MTGVQFGGGGREGTLFLHHNVKLTLGPTQAFNQRIPGFLPQGTKQLTMNLTTRLNHVQRLRIRGTLPPLRHMISVVIKPTHKFKFLQVQIRAGIAQWYSAGLRAGWSGVRVPAAAGNFSLHHRVQTGSEAHPASYPMGTRGSFPGG
jgi:hypothetical protein